MRICHLRELKPTVQGITDHSAPRLSFNLTPSVTGTCWSPPPSSASETKELCFMTASSVGDRGSRPRVRRRRDTEGGARLQADGFLPPWTQAPALCVRQGWGNSSPAQMLQVRLSEAPMGRVDLQMTPESLGLGSFATEGAVQACVKKCHQWKIHITCQK